MVSSPLTAVLSSLWLVTAIGMSSGNSITGSKHDSTVVDPVTGDNMIRRWQRMEDGMKFAMNMILDESLPAILRATRGINISSPCQESLSFYVQDLRQVKRWAIMMLDATAKIPSGMMDIGFTDFGSYDQCLKISVGELTNGRRTAPFTGQYCSIKILPPLPPKTRFYTVFQTLPDLKDFPHRDSVAGFMSNFAHFFYTISMRWGTCVPSTCTKDDVQNVANLISQYTEYTAEVSFCQVKTTSKLTSEQKFVIFILAVVFLFITAGTAVDFYLRSQPAGLGGTIQKMHGRKKKITEFLFAFSAYNNAMRLLDTSNASDGLSALHGIRFITISWVILGHTYLFVNYEMFRNLSGLLSSSKNLVFQAISNGAVAVDTFFFISGLLTSYVTLNVIQRNNTRLSIPVYLFHRFWRLTPAYMMIICLTFLVPLLGSGPLWHESVDHLVDSCRSTWWANVIYLQNFITPSEQCLQHSWFLSVDFQFHLISLFVILPLIRGKARLGLKAAAGLTAACTLITAVVTWVRDYPPTELFVHPNQDARMEMKSDIYYKPYPHMGAYCVGLLLGYLLAQNIQFNLSRGVQFIGWIVSVTCCLVVLFGVHEWNRGQVPTAEVSALYAATHRTIWALGIAWIVFSCISRKADALNNFLSWKPLIPLSRLTYMAYLVHPHLQWIFVGLVHERMYYSTYYMVYNFIGHLVVTYIVAFVCSVAFESPFLALEKLFFNVPVAETTGSVSKKRG